MNYKFIGCLARDIKIEVAEDFGGLGYEVICDADRNIIDLYKEEE